MNMNIQLDISFCKKLHLLPITNQVIALHTIIRNKDTSIRDFVLYSNRLFRLILEYAIGFLPFETSIVVTPTNKEYEGKTLCNNICGVSIMRGGDAMAAELRTMIPDIKIGKILIQREEATAKPLYYYDRLPDNIENQHILLMDPMLATAGTAMCAIDVLKKKNVLENRIIFVSLIAAPEGIIALHKEYPDVTIITSQIDEGLNDQMFILPGIGDYGDRYFGT